MALLPYLLDMDIQPRRHRFELDLEPEDLLGEILRPVLRRQQYLKPWRSLAAAARDLGSTIKADKDKFQVNLDVQHFAPEEISVKTADGYVVIEGKHEEKKDDHGFVSRQFSRRYALPEDCNPDTVESKLSSDGFLTIVAPKKSLSLKNERAVPITQTGPVRRKQADEEEAEKGDQNGQMEIDEKVAQKKPKRR